MPYLWRRDRGRSERLTDISASANFSRSFSKWYSICQGTIFGGSYVLKRITGACELSGMGAGNLNSGPLEEQQGIFITEPPLQPPPFLQLPLLDGVELLQRPSSNVVSARRLHRSPRRVTVLCHTWVVMQRALQSAPARVSLSTLKWLGNTSHLLITPVLSGLCTMTD